MSAVYPITLAHRWTVGSPERQRAAAEIELARFRRTGLPAGFRDLTAYTSLNGESVLFRAELVHAEAFRAYVLDPAREVERKEVDQAVPGIVRHGATGYRGHRTIRNAPGKAVCTSVVETHFTEPDEALYWAVDVVNMGKWSGTLYSRFFVSMDHAQALTIIEWSDTDAVPATPPPDGARSRSGNARQNRAEYYREYETLTAARR